MNDEQKITNFLFEVGTMRKLARMHRQVLLTDDLSDSIASHSYRVTIIGWFLAKMEKVDPYKVVMMCLLHDLDESRSGDHNWVHKRYTKVFEEEINKEQLGELPFDDLFNIQNEYNTRESKESLVAKDADSLDQVLLLREYEWAGNKEASIWLSGKGNKDGENRQIKNLVTDSAKKLGKAIFEISPSDWWNNLFTDKRR